MSKRNWFIGAALVAGLTLSGTTAAMAGVTPSPSPSHPVVQPRAALWQFDFAGVQTDGLTLNNVRGAGALAFNRWQETDLSPNLSKFASPISANSVTLRHNRLPLPTINLGTCTASFDQIGRFRIVAGTGIGANLRVVPGTSQYILKGLVSFDRLQLRHGNYINRSICPLQFVSPGTLRANIEANNLMLSGELASLVDFDVQGNALLVRVRPLPVPSPTGPGHFFSPTVTPSA